MNAKPLIPLMLLFAFILPASSLTGNGTTIISGEVFPATIVLDYYYYPFLFPNFDNLLVWHYYSNGSEIMGNFSIMLDNFTTFLNYSQYYAAYPAIINVLPPNESFVNLSVNASASAVGYASASLISGLIITTADRVCVGIYKDNLTQPYKNEAGWVFAYPVDSQYAKARAFNRNSMTLLQDIITWQKNQMSPNVTYQYEYPEYVYSAQYIKGNACLALPNATQYSFIYTEGFYSVPSYYSKPTYSVKKNEQYLGAVYVAGDVNLKFKIDEFSLNLWGNLFRYILLGLVVSASLVIAVVAWYATANPAPLFGWFLGIIPIVVLLNLLLKVMLS